MAGLSSMAVGQAMGLSLAVPSDAEILQAFADGDTEAAAAAFVRKYQAFVYATAYRFLQSREDALDVAQEVFLRAIQHIHKFRGESSIKTWLYVITRNAAASWVKKYRREVPFPEDFQPDQMLRSPDALPDQQVEGREMQEILDRIIAQLPEKQREVFVLRHIEGMSYEEISKITGTSVGGLKANYFHALKKIGKQLRAYGYDIPE